MRSAIIQKVALQMNNGKLMRMINNMHLSHLCTIFIWIREKSHPNFSNIYC